METGLKEDTTTSEMLKEESTTSEMLKVEESEEALEAQVQAIMAQTKKKKKKKDKKKKKKEKKEKKKKETKENEGTKNSDGYPYPYQLLLDRAYEYLKRDQPQHNSTDKSCRLKLPLLNICRYKTTRTNWSNFAKTCQVMQRPPDHLLAFIEHELAVRAAVNGSGHLVLPTRIDSRRMGQLLHKYVTNYVLCIRCGSHNTSFYKDKIRRILFVDCITCHAQTAAQPIRAPGTSSGHVALKKGDRYRARRGLQKK